MQRRFISFSISFWGPLGYLNLVKVSQFNILWVKQFVSFIIAFCFVFLVCMSCTIFS